MRFHQGKRVGRGVRTNAESLVIQDSSGYTFSSCNSIYGLCINLNLLSGYSFSVDSDQLVRFI